jgi:hypothetical protein
MDAAFLEGDGIILSLQKPVYPVFFPVFSESHIRRQVRLRLHPPPATSVVYERFPVGVASKSKSASLPQIA